MSASPADTVLSPHYRDGQSSDMTELEPQFDHSRPRALTCSDRDAQDRDVQGPPAFWESRLTLLPDSQQKALAGG